MDNGYAYGMGPGSTITITGGPTGTVVEGLKFSSDAEQELEVRNNDAGQTIAQSVMTNKKSTVSGTAEFKGWVNPDALINCEATIAAGSANTMAVTSGSIVATIKHAGIDSNRGNWMFDFSATIHATVV